MIEALGLYKTFEDQKRGLVHAVENVSFTCQPGKVFALLGPNGAGKTSTLRILSTVIAPSSGTALVAGHDILREPQEVRRKLGFLSGDTGLYPRLNPDETLDYFGALYGLAPDVINSRKEKIFRQFRIDEFRKARNDKLSSGMKQKVNLARTLIHNPPVLILDEPTVGLDVLTSRTIIEFIRTCQEEGKCILFSTHIMSEVEALADQVAIIYRGRILAIGTAESLKDKTASKHLDEAFLKLVEEVDQNAPISKSVESK